MAIPTGPIKAVSGLDWSAITRYDAFIHEAADPVGWPIERVRGHIVIESKGDPYAIQENDTNGWSYGLMQVVPYGIGWEGWHALIKEKAGLSKNASRNQVTVALKDPHINIAVGVAILEAYYQQHGALDKASSSFFLGKPGWGGNDTVNGTTGRQYRDTLNALIKEQEAFQPVDPYDVIFGKGWPKVTYGFGADVGLALYEYGIAHGLGGRGTRHTGDDVGVPDETRLLSPFAGTVVCVGANGWSGTPAWASGCGFFNDESANLGHDRNIGNISILSDSGYRLTLGHCSDATVTPGQRVNAGQMLGYSGGMNGDHCHVEMREKRGNTYWLIDPKPALMAAMGGQVVIPDPVYATRLPVPQPEEFDILWTVEVVTDGVKLLQSTAPGAPEVASPFSKGEQFKAPYITIGQDGSPFWISSLGSRIPLAGTRLLGEPLFGPVGSVDTTKVLDSLQSLHAALEATERVVDETMAALEGAA